MKQGTGVVGELCKDVFIPKMVKVHQKFDLSYIKPEDIPGVVRAQLDRDIIASKIKPGMTIAITCGSRGVSNTALIIKTIASYVKEKGAKPFVFPAMGSHGGATPEGQTQIVNGYGVVEDYVGCPIRATMETKQIGTTDDGRPVFIDKYAKFAQFCEKQGTLCICEKKNAITLGKSIQERAKRHGSEISRELAEQLASRCLCDSTLIHTELDKLLACADGEPITQDMMDALVAALPDADAFRLARAVTGGNGTAAFRMLRDLTAKAEDSKTILGLLSVLSTAFIDLYRAKLGQSAAKQTDRIAADFGYPKNREFAVRNAMRDCGPMTVPQLRTCIRILRETDKSCKSSRTAPRLLLEQAVVRMLRVRRDGTEAAG